MPGLSKIDKKLGKPYTRKDGFGYHEKDEP